ncbi:MAG: small basic protein [Candidatus Omnitrophota bacterium]
MSQHPSLKGSQEGGKFRSVLKRYEKIKELADKEKWEEEDSVYSLPKIKRIKFKIKKTKAAAEEGAGVEGAAAGAVGGPPAKGGAPGKGVASGKEGAPVKGAAPAAGGASAGKKKGAAKK